VQELLTYSFIVAYIKYVIMLIDKQSATSGAKVFVYQIYQSPKRINHTKNYGCECLAN